MLNNHLRFTILYFRDLETDLARIVGFEVEPFSVKHSYEGTWDSTGLFTARAPHTRFVYPALDDTVAYSPAHEFAACLHSMRTARMPLTPEAGTQGKRSRS